MSGCIVVDDAGVFTDPISQGARAARYISMATPVGAFGGAIYAFKNGEWWGLGLGVLASIYLVFWIVANCSAMVVITVRNWYATHSEIRSAKTGTPPGQVDEEES